jgi:hypothetical protein
MTNIIGDRKGRSKYDPDLANRVNKEFEKMPAPVVQSEGEFTGTPANGVKKIKICTLPRTSYIQWGVYKDGIAVSIRVSPNPNGSMQLKAYTPQYNGYLITDPHPLGPNSLFPLCDFSSFGDTIAYNQNSLISILNEKSSEYAQTSPEDLNAINKWEAYDGGVLLYKRIIHKGIFSGTGGIKVEMHGIDGKVTELVEGDFNIQGITKFANGCVFCPEMNGLIKYVKIDGKKVKVKNARNHDDLDTKNIYTINKEKKLQHHFINSFHEMQGSDKYAVIEQRLFNNANIFLLAEDGVPILTHCGVPNPSKSETHKWKATKNGVVLSIMNENDTVDFYLFRFKN